MIASFDTPEVQFAVQAAQLAASVVQQVQQDLAARSLDKSDRSPVTVADFASQAVVAALLERAFPNDTLVAEEDASLLRTSQGNRCVLW